MDESQQPLLEPASLESNPHPLDAQANQFEEDGQSRTRVIWGQFKNFIEHRNLLDFSIALIVGTAFSQLVNSFVEDMFSPLLGILLTNQLSEKFLVLKAGEHEPYLTREEAKKDGAVTWNYGNFIQLSLNFMIVSASCFAMFRVFCRVRKHLHHMEQDD
jgi:large conductance mechanosensitive channel